MKKGFILFSSFRAKITIALVLLMLFAGSVSDFIIYEYSLKAQLDQLRDKLMSLAHAAALTINADDLLKIPLNRSGMDAPEYKSIKRELFKINKISPFIDYIYVLTKTEKQGIYRFVIDVGPAMQNKKREDAYPGEAYDGGRFPELGNAFSGPSADRELVTDEWGVFLSGYAPIRDDKGNAVAILGIDLDARDVHKLQGDVRERSLLVLLFGVLLSLFLGTLISMKISRPVKKLVEGTRHIASGDLQYQVKVGGYDEISELAAAFNNMAKSLDKARKELVNYFYRVVQSLIRALEARDPYTSGHSDRVSQYSVRIASKMGLDQEKIELLKEAALLHDIGKLGIQESILYKKAELDVDERNTIKKHPAIGEEILKPVTQDAELLSIVRGHHERYDGKGYPDGLSGDKIGLLPAIVAAADSYDAMTSHRGYRKDLTTDEVVEQFRKNSGTQFNPEVVEAFLKVLQEGM